LAGVKSLLTGIALNKNTTILYTMSEKINAKNQESYYLKILGRVLFLNLKIMKCIKSEVY
jgi:hypothetical protein